MNRKSVVMFGVIIVVVLLMLLAMLFGRPEKGGTVQESSFISGDEKDQSSQAYIPPNAVKYPKDYCQHFNENEEFDFVIVGAGAGGATVAHRLAEDAQVRVLLMEAGGDPPPQSDIPSQFGHVAPEELWHFHTVDNEGLCQGYETPGCPYPFAKILGGNTIINAMNYLRGNRQDFDDWAKIGCTGWSYKEVLPYFKKSENYSQHPLLSTEDLKKSNDLNAADRSFHGTGGPLQVSAFKKDLSTNALREAMTKAQVENGIKYNPDVNGADQMGVTNLGGMVDYAGYRSSVAKAFLLNIPDNLKVCKYSTAITLELTDKTVTGVNFQYNGTGEVKNYRVKAKREYILSAGPFNTAPLLERSGIGRKDVLEKLGIEVKHELPGVGENYQEHFSSRMAFKVDYLSDAAPNPLSTPLCNFASFINTSNPESSVPDVHLLGISSLPSGVKQSITDQLENVSKSRGLVFVNVVHLRHPNPGSVHTTQTKDPSISPEIITNHLTTKLEKERIVKASQLVRKFMSSDALKPHRVEPVVLDDCKQYEFNSEDEIICQKRILGLPFHHACGTTAMGPRENPNSVVDPELRVIGLENVRIVDSGVIPLIPRGHTTAATVMIGEKAADIIKSYWK